MRDSGGCFVKILGPANAMGIVDDKRGLALSNSDRVESESDHNERGISHNPGPLNLQESEFSN